MGSVLLLVLAELTQASILLGGACLVCGTAPNAAAARLGDTTHLESANLVGFAHGLWLALPRPPMSGRS
jgi:hypothetical protein